MFSVTAVAPTLDEFCSLRSSVGWGDTDRSLAQASLENSLFHVSIRRDEDTIGMGRVIGDGAMYFYIQDVVILPEFQGQKVGDLVMDKIENYLSSTAKKGATVGLLCAAGKEGFYQRYGYIERPTPALGKGMCRFV